MTHDPEKIGALNGAVVEKGQDKQADGFNTSAKGNTVACPPGDPVTIGGEPVFYNPRTCKEGTFPPVLDAGTISDGTAPTC